VVEIGGRDPELGRHPALVEPTLAAKPLKARTKEKLSLTGHTVSL
jgi:hypothetical protein